MRQTLNQQIAWAAGREAQARRLASTMGPATPAGQRQVQMAATAEAVVASLRRLQTLQTTNRN